MRTLLAQLDARDGRIDTAITALDAQLNAIEETGQRCLEAEVHRVRGELLIQRTPPSTLAAHRAFRRAMEIARSQKGEDVRAPCRTRTSSAPLEDPTTVS